MARRTRTFAAALLIAGGASSPVWAVEDTGATARLSGKVRRGESGAEAASVKLCGLAMVDKTARGGQVKWEGCRTNQEAVTDASGRYSFTELPPGQYAVMARSGDGWSYIGSPVHPASSYVRLSNGFHVFIATYAAKAGAETTAETIQLLDHLKRIEPVADAQLATGHPTLRWEAVPGAAYYEVSLHKLSALRRGSEISGWTIWRSVFERRRVASGTALDVREPLANCDYGWEVTAFTQGGVKVGQVTGPIAPSHFTVTGQRASCN